MDVCNFVFRGSFTFENETFSIEPSNRLSSCLSCSHQVSSALPEDYLSKFKCGKVFIKHIATHSVILFISFFYKLKTLNIQKTEIITQLVYVNIVFFNKLKLIRFELISYFYSIFYLKLISKQKHKI